MSGIPRSRDYRVLILDPDIAESTFGVAVEQSRHLWREQHRRAFPRGVIDRIDDPRGPKRGPRFPFSPVYTSRRGAGT